MDNTNPCTPNDLPHAVRTLSHGGVGHVALCGCGHLHLNLEYLTLRFEPAAFRELALLLAQARHRLDAEALVRAADAGADTRCPVH